MYEGYPGRSCSKGISAYAVDVSNLVSCEDQLPCVEDCIARYEAVTGAKINQVKSVKLRLGTSRDNVLVQ